MKTNISHSRTSADASLTHSPTSPSSVKPEEKPFVYFATNSDLSFEEKSAIYCSLVSLVKAGYPFDDALLSRAARFLKDLEPKWDAPDLADKLVTELVPSSDGSPSDFIESISTLLSSPHSTVVEAAFSFLYESICYSSFAVRCCLVESDLISKLLATAQIHTLPISINRTIFGKFVYVIIYSLQLARPFYISELDITTPVDAFNHREMIFQKVVIPSSQFVTFLISNRHILNEDLLGLFMYLLWKILEIGPFHRPTLEFVVASPIVMAFSSSLSFVENHRHLETSLININDSLTEWKRAGPEVAQSGIRMLQAMFTGEFEDTLDQMMTHNKNGSFGRPVVKNCLPISQLLGSNAKKRR